MEATIFSALVYAAQIYTESTYCETDITKILKCELDKHTPCNIGNVDSCKINIKHSLYNYKSNILNPSFSRDVYKYYDLTLPEISFKIENKFIDITKKSQCSYLFLRDGISPVSYKYIKTGFPPNNSDFEKSSPIIRTSNIEESFILTEFHEGQLWEDVARLMQCSNSTKYMIGVILTNNKLDTIISRLNYLLLFLRDNIVKYKNKIYMMYQNGGKIEYQSIAINNFDYELISGFSGKTQSGTTFVAYMIKLRSNNN